MAYTYVSALARKRAIDANWQTVDLSAIDVNVVYSTYEKVYLTLSNPVYPHPIYLDLDTVRAMIGVRVPGKTIPQWLAGLGNASLPTFNTAPTFITHTVLYKDAWKAGYDIQPADHTASPHSQLPTGALNDLYLTRPNTDYGFMWQHALVSVNGYIHYTGQGPDGVYVVDGMSTTRKVNDNQCGVLSFEDVGALHYLPIADAMIYNIRGTELFSHFVYVNLGQSLAGKSLLFVLGGHLHCMDEAYSIIGDGLVRINIDKIPWAEIFFDCLKNLDMSSVTWGTTINNPSQITVEDLYSDAVVQAVLQLTQTFFVVVDTPELYLVRHACERSKLPGRWQHPTLAQYPLVGPMGRLIDYVPQWENTLYVLKGPALYDTNYNFETTQWRNAYSIAPNRISREPIMYPKAFLMELGTQSLAPTA